MRSLRGSAPVAIGIADQEIDGILAAGMQHELSRSATTLDEVKRVHRRLPCGQVEFDHVREIVTLWQRNGRNVRPLPLGLDATALTDAELRETVTRAARDGLIFVSALDLKAGLLVVRVDAGRGLFGRERALYACFLETEDGSLHAVGTVKTLSVALTKLVALYRV